MVRALGVLRAACRMLSPHSRICAATAPRSARLLTKLYCAAVVQRRLRSSTRVAACGPGSCVEPVNSPARRLFAGSLLLQCVKCAFRCGSRGWHRPWCAVRAPCTLHLPAVSHTHAPDNEPAAAVLDISYALLPSQVPLCCSLGSACQAFCVRSTDALAWPHARLLISPCKHKLLLIAIGFDNSVAWARDLRELSTLLFFLLRCAHRVARAAITRRRRTPARCCRVVEACVARCRLCS